MKDITGGQFYNPSRGNISFTDTIEEIAAWIQEEPGCFYDVVVGCDSPSSTEPFFPVAIVVLRRGQGGRFFLRRINYDRKFYHWKERILEEVILSCQLALELREVLTSRLDKLPFDAQYDFEHIHADIGGKGATKSMVREVTGIIKGNGFTPVIKPESYVASSVADRYT